MNSKLDQAQLNSQNRAKELQVGISARKRVISNKETSEKPDESVSKALTSDGGAQSKRDSINHDAEYLYMRDIEFVPLLTASDERELGRKIRAGDEAARERMIKSNLRLVVKIARRYHVSKLGLLDLIEEGNIGLMHAVTKFDPEKGFRFSTYASWWIRHEIERSIMNQSRTVRLPVHVVREVNKYKRASYELVQTLQHEPNIQEIAERTENSVADVSRLMNLNRPSASMDEPIGTRDDGNFTMLDGLANAKSEDPADMLQRHEVSEHIGEWLDFLGEKPREIIERRFGLKQFGLERGEPQTLEQVAKEVGLTRERVRQIQIQALEKLNGILRKNGYSWEDVSDLKE